MLWVIVALISKLSTFDFFIVTLILTDCVLSSTPQKLPASGKPAKHPDSRTAYDILNHVPKASAHPPALLYPEGERAEVHQQQSVVGGGKKPYTHKKRDVDVITNR